MQVLPGCLLLHFAAADLQEAGGDVDAARQVYQDLLPSLVPDETPATPAPQVPLHPCCVLPFAQFARHCAKALGQCL